MSEHTVLCVDDEVHILNSLKRMLRKEDYTVLTGCGGQEGLDVLEKQSVHLVISDQRMPGMMGIEFLQKVKELYPDTVRVVLSGYADVAVVVESINKGEIYRFLTKPWNDDELKAAIGQCLAHYQMAHDNQDLMEQVRAQNEELRRFNEGLEQSVEARTRSLRMSQEILEKLPIPVMGIDREESIVLFNEAVRKAFPTFGALPPGVDMAEVLPAEVVDPVREWLGGARPDGPLSVQWEGQTARVRIELLDGHSSPRGCILIWEIVG